MIMFELCSTGSAMVAQSAVRKPMPSGITVTLQYCNIPIRPIVIESGEEVVAPFSKVGESEQG